MHANSEFELAKFDFLVGNIRTVIHSDRLDSFSTSLKDRSQVSICVRDIVAMQLRQFQFQKGCDEHVCKFLKDRNEHLFTILHTLSRSKLLYNAERASIVQRSRQGSSSLVRTFHARTTWAQQVASSHTIYCKENSVERASIVQKSLKVRRL